MVNAKGLNSKDKAKAMAEEAKTLLADNHARIDAILQKIEEAIAF